LRPSETTSLHGTFPVQQPTPVRILLAAFSSQGSQNPSTGQQQLPIIDPELLGDTALQTPAPRRILSEKDFTMTGRVRHARHLLSNSASGSILTSNHSITAEEVDRLNPAPQVERVVPSQMLDWQLLDNPSATVQQLRLAFGAAHDHAISQQAALEASNAMLIIQSLTVRKLNQALHGREELAKEKRGSRFPKGFGICATSAEMILALEQREEERELEVSALAQRKAIRAQNKEAKDAVEARWLVMKSEHASELAAWEKLKADGIIPLPGKPKRPRKPKAALIPVDVEDSLEDEEFIPLD
ncbi:hypothetical protein BKA62DRAFT_622459, partial [Auriculariales sp. MPI-PUGE-AT-0066]